MRPVDREWSGQSRFARMPAGWDFTDQYGWATYRHLYELIGSW